MLEIGSIVDDKYKILSEIGHGGMSVVYMAINEKANKTWAIKEVRKDGVLDFEAVRQGLIVETDMLKKLKHPNLPSIVDVIDSDDTFLIVMDYIEGNALSVTLRDYGAQPQEYVIDWARQLCDVLGYLHSREPAIIYRDMKPANVMLKPDGNLTLIDFGTAREYKEKNLADTTCLGTIGYAAPEQFGGMGQTDGRTDIYCLGATLYHLVTGCNPSEPPYEIKPIREINASLSGGLEQIIIKCTQRNPEDRYQSCAELMYALEHFEEIDDGYRKKQRGKLRVFMAAAVMTIISLTLGVGTGQAAGRMATDNYESLMEEAAKTTDYEQKKALYEEAVGIPDKSGEKSAYLELIKLFKEDNVFTVEEQKLLVSLIKNNQIVLKENVDAYVEICFETGKLFWYYYNYGDGSDNQVVRMKSAIEWFQDVIRNAPEDYVNLGMAQVYSSIGEFYRDIAINTVEASDRGLYQPFFVEINELMDQVCGDETESEIVVLELLELVRSSLQQYATKFKTDGVTWEDISALYDRVALEVANIETQTDKTTEKKNLTAALLEDTERAIAIAYGVGTEGGE
ncbi:MAG: serine/threonine protein kinase [Lachnospiraceae bacterium]|nr:serine/threonine protein kinase [Lachnospiraceae bacterium]